jgi:hypothetical protein
MQIFCVVERIGCGEYSPTFRIFPCTSPQPHALSPLPNPAPSRESLLRTLVRQLAWGAKRCPEATEECSVLSASAVRLRNGSPTGVFGGLRRQRRRDLLPRGGQRFAVPFEPRGTRDGSLWRSLCPTVPTSDHWYIWRTTAPNLFWSMPIKSL